MVKKSVIKTFSGYSEDTIIASLVLRLLKEKLSSIYICRNLVEGSDRAVVGFRVLWYKGLEFVYEVSQAGPLYWAVPAQAFFPHKIVVVWPSCRDVGSIEEPGSRQGGQPSFSYKHNDNSMKKQGMSRASLV